MRLDYRKVFPQGAQALADLETALHSGPLEPELVELVKIRASQVNGCAYCLAMHHRDARARGASQVRLGSEVTSLEGIDFPPSGA